MSFKNLVAGLLLGTVILAGCSDSETDGAKEDDIFEADVELMEEASADSPVEEEEKVEDDFATEEEESTIESNVQGNTEFEGINFNLPENAEQLEVPDQGMPVALYIIDQNDRSNVNVVVEQLPMKMELKDYIEAATSITGFDYQSIDYYNVNGMEWNEAVSFNTQEGTQLNQRTFIHDDRAYIFTYGSLPENYEKHLDVFNSITESVLINGQQ